MTSTIKVNTITTESGSTLTVGGCGKTVALASGASQTGFGRTGTVDWQTGSIKTTTFTPSNGEGYFCDTSSGGFTANLPAGSAGAIVSFSDYTRTFQNNNLTISPNGSEKIGGIASDAFLSTEGQTATFVYVDGTEGWINIQETSNSVTGNDNLVATGGTVTTCGNDKIHTFTGPGTFAVSQVSPCAANNLVSYLVVAGGGAGGSDYAATSGGGGGAGGYRELVSPSAPYTGSPTQGYPTPGNRITVTASSFPITVGGGATANPTGPGPETFSSGSASIFSSITSAGGGGGASNRQSSPSPSRVAGAGGSGGGANFYSAAGGTPGAAGNTPPTTPAQGTNGGNGGPSGGSAAYGSGGGGGATVAGTNGTCSAGGAGGAGATSEITGSPVVRAGGGGGAGWSDGPSSSAGAGGSGGGAAGGADGGNPGNAGTTNTGGGGGGASGAPGCTTNVGGNGGSGIVIIRYKYQ